MSSDEVARASAWAQGQPVGAIGEFDLITRLRRKISAAGTRERPTAESRVITEAGDRGRVILGLGDDASLYRPPAGWDLVLTCDIQIEGRHFLREWLSPVEAGRRAAMVNMSDIAAMGGVPTVALVSLGVPPELPIAAVAAIYDGLIDAFAAHGAVIAGGNITRADRLLLDVSLIGRVEAGRALRRSAAQPGETVFVTGLPGRAAAALQALHSGGDLWERLADARRRAKPDGEAAAHSGGESAPEGRSAPRTPGSAAHSEISADDLKEHFRLFYAVPAARVDVGRHLLHNQLAGAAIDQSDGVTGDLAHICEESGVGILLEEASIPIDPDLARLADFAGSDPLGWVLGPSDDYQLLFTTPRGKIDGIFAMSEFLGVLVTPVGTVQDGPPVVRLRRRDGAVEELSGGWDHLSQNDAASDAGGETGSNVGGNPGSGSGGHTGNAAGSRTRSGTVRHAEG